MTDPVNTMWQDPVTWLGALHRPVAEMRVAFLEFWRLVSLESLALSTIWWNSASGESRERLLDAVPDAVPPVDEELVTQLSNRVLDAFTTRLASAPASLDGRVLRREAARLHVEVTRRLLAPAWREPGPERPFSPAGLIHDLRMIGQYDDHWQMGRSGLDWFALLDESPADGSLGWEIADRRALAITENGRKEGLDRIRSIQCRVVTVHRHMVPAIMVAASPVGLGLSPLPALLATCAAVGLAASAGSGGPMAPSLGLDLETTRVEVHVLPDLAVTPPREAPPPSPEPPAEEAREAAPAPPPPRPRRPAPRRAPAPAVSAPVQPDAGAPVNVPDPVVITPVLPQPRPAPLPPAPRPAPPPPLPRVEPAPAPAPPQPPAPLPLPSGISESALSPALQSPTVALVRAAARRQQNGLYELAGRTVFVWKTSQGTTVRTLAAVARDPALLEQRLAIAIREMPSAQPTTRLP